MRNAVSVLALHGPRNDERGAKFFRYGRTDGPQNAGLRRVFKNAGCDGVKLAPVVPLADGVGNPDQAADESRMGAFDDLRGVAQRLYLETITVQVRACEPGP